MNTTLPIAIIAAIFGFARVSGYLNVRCHVEDQLVLAQDVDPDDIKALQNKGNDLAESDKYEEAITYYDKALAINPSDPIPLSNKGLALNQLGKYEEAITYFDKASTIDPDDTLSKTGKSEAPDKLGR